MTFPEEVHEERTCRGDAFLPGCGVLFRLEPGCGETAFCDRCLELRNRMEDEDEAAE